MLTIDEYKRLAATQKRELSDLYGTDDLVSWLESRGWQCERVDRDATGRDKSQVRATKRDTVAKDLSKPDATYKIAEVEGVHTRALHVMVLEHKGEIDWPDRGPNTTQGDVRRR